MSFLWFEPAIFRQNISTNSFHFVIQDSKHKIDNESVFSISTSTWYPNQDTVLGSVVQNETLNF